MNLFPKDIESKLGFDQIRSMLLNECHSERGKKLATKASPTDRFDMLKKWLAQVAEMRQLKSSGTAHLSFEFPDIDDYLKRIEVPGSFLNPEDLHSLKTGVKTITLWSFFFDKNGQKYPHLSTLVERLNMDTHLINEIDRVIDERGGVRTTASSALSEIRSQIAKSEKSVRSAIQKVLRKAKDNSYAEENSTLTVREGRLVIPIKAAFKRRIKGFVHDESATGHTVYLEPGEVLELNNQVKELYYRERREVTRILIDLADKVRTQLPELKKGTNLLEKLDFIHAKAKVGDLIDGLIPKAEDKPTSNLVGAIHPLLYLTHKENGKSVVPLNLNLNTENRILVISGPNAGGKSVALKTVGLLHYMFQTGIPIPVKEESRLGVFSSIFIDIGDTQSIEDDVSTYSSHLSSMSYFLGKANRKTLFLIDEFGKGTEPQFGGAIAESVLIELNKKKSYGVITTHYQNLKNIGDREHGLFNGAMKYDLDALEPLFELETGKPGSSFAFEIAGKIGLPDAIILSAKQSIGSTHVAYDQMLSMLEKEKSKYEKMNKKMVQKEVELQKIREDYEQLRQLLAEEKDKVIKEAKYEAGRIVEGANKEIERTIREIKESKAAKERTRKARHKINALKANYDQPIVNKKQAIEPGDRVKVDGQDVIGLVRKINGKQAEVIFGTIKSIVNLSKLSKTQQELPSYQREKRIRKAGIDISSKRAHFSHELTVRGMRAEEALTEVEAFIDEALLLGMDEVKIIHGKGHGVLRSMVRNYGKGHP